MPKAVKSRGRPSIWAWLFLVASASFLVGMLALVLL